jgi:hypothetical protein
MLNTTLEDPSKVVSSHFPDSHLYHMSGGGQYNRAQRQEADYTSVVDEHVKRRKTTQEYHKPEKKESKEAPESDGDSSAGEAAVAKPLRSNKRGHRYQRAQGSVRNAGDAASAKSLISNESRAKSQSKPQASSRDRHQPPTGKARPQPTNSCYWCGELLATTAFDHFSTCISRTHNSKKCRGCHKVFYTGTSPPWLSEDYVRHICYCDRLRCTRCPGEKHDTMVCPKTRCTRNCPTNHLRGFCDFGDRLATWRRDK